MEKVRNKIECLASVVDPGSNVESGEKPENDPEIFPVDFDQAPTLDTSGSLGKPVNLILEC